MLAVALAAVAPGAVAAPGTAQTVHYEDLNDAPQVVDPQFSWSPIAGAARYEVEVNSSNDWAVGSRVCCDDRVIGTSLSPQKLLPNNTYYWRVRAIDAAGNAGPWNVWCHRGDEAPCPDGSPPASFEKTFDDVVPTVPNLHVRDPYGDDVPDVDASGVPISDAPIVAWDPVPGASSYEMRLSPWDTRSGGFCNWSSTAGNTYKTASTAWTPLANPIADSPVGNAHPGITRESFPLEGGTTYCVRVRARTDRDARGDEIVSDWTVLGDHGAFTYEPAAIAPCEAIAMPESAYHDEPSTSVATPRTPLFTWDWVDGACGYFVVVAKDAAFTKVVDVAYTIIPAYTPRLTTYSDETTSYYWAVMPSLEDGDGVSTAPQEDSPQTFDKRSVPPQLISPPASALVRGEPSFRWRAAEGAREYRIQVDTDRFFGSPLTDVVTDSTAYTGTVRYPPSTVLYWRVRADDENKLGLGWSDVGTFTALSPETLVTSGPSVTGSDMTVSFASDVADASFKCRLEGPRAAALAPCSSPKSYLGLPDGSYTFSVVASDLAGNADPTPASRTFRVDTSAPDTTITSGPPTATSSTTATFALASTEPGATFECRLDGPEGHTGTWSSCTSPAVYSGLEDGGYTFSARSTDATGNVDATAATRSFAVDTEAPDTTMASGPRTLTGGGQASFTFASGDATAAFQCRLDGPGTAGDWTSCGSPAAYSVTEAGSYTFTVRAVDAAGNADATPATWTFTVLPAPVSPPPPDNPFEPVVTPTPVPDEPSTPPVARRGAFTFAAPGRPISVRHGRVRLRFTCAPAAGCAGATFRLTHGADGLRIRLAAGARGPHVVAVRLTRPLRRAVAHAGRRGLRATVRRTSAGRGVRVTLTAARR